MASLTRLHFCRSLSRRASVAAVPASTFRSVGKSLRSLEWDILSDYVWEDAEGHKFGAFVFARGGLLAGLDLYSVEGAATPTSLPKPDQLTPLCSDDATDLTR